MTFHGEKSTMQCIRGFLRNLGPGWSDVQREPNWHNINRSCFISPFTSSCLQGKSIERDYRHLCPCWCFKLVGSDFFQWYALERWLPSGIVKLCTKFLLITEVLVHLMHSNWVHIDIVFIQMLDKKHSPQAQMLTYFLPSIMKGGLLGFLTSLATGLTLMVGSTILYTFKEPNPPSLSVTGCLNVSNAAPSSSSDYPFSFFNLSYLYFTPACLIVGFVVAAVVSLLTGEFSFCVLFHRSQFPLSNHWSRFLWR